MQYNFYIRPLLRGRHSIKPMINWQAYLTHWCVDNTNSKGVIKITDESFRVQKLLTLTGTRTVSHFMVLPLGYLPTRYSYMVGITPVVQLWGMTHTWCPKTSVLLGLWYNTCTLLKGMPSYSASFSIECWHMKHIKMREMFIFKWYQNMTVVVVNLERQTDRQTDRQRERIEEKERIHDRAFRLG